MTRLVSDVEKQAEIAIVGWALQNPRRVSEVDLDWQHFDDKRLADAWGAIADMSLTGESVDAVTVAAHLSREGRADMPLSFLTQVELQACIFPDKYAAIVRGAWVTRQVLSACSETIAARGEGVDADDLLSLALEKLAGVQVEQRTETQHIGQLAKQRFGKLADIATAKAKGEAMATGVMTGIASLDRLLGGLQRGIPTVVAARPGMGKSAFAMTVSDHVSSQGAGAHVFSLEDTRDAYTDRSLSRETRVVEAQRIRSCDLNDGDLMRIRNAADVLFHRTRWLVDDRSGITAEEVVRSVRRELKRNNTQVVIVDYIQLLKAPRGTPRQQANDRTWVADHSMHVLADAAKQDGISYLVLSQLNRELERRPDKRPMLSDLKQSGTIEERAKTVLMLYRPAVYDDKAPQDVLEIIVSKNNNGATGYVEAKWDGPVTRID